MTASRCRWRGRAAARKVWADVFVDTENAGPRRIVQRIRRFPRVVRADALFGEPDIVAIAGTKVARWIP